MIYLECVCKVFQKYRVSFRLENFYFLKEGIEYVCHDVTEDVNCPAQSNFYLINDWKLPTNGQSLFLFIGLVYFYYRYSPYFELCMNPLRKFLKIFYRKPIPLMAWTPALIEIFNKLKKVVTSSKVLARFDTNKLTFLKTYWRPEVVGSILMQPIDDEESQQVVKLLRETREFLFNLSKMELS